MPSRLIPIRAFPRGAAAFLCLALILSACDGPFTESKNDRPGLSGADSLDAELGKDKSAPYDFTQGKFVATGGTLDLALEGRGFFVLRNEARSVYFRRPARFNADAEGYLNLGNVQTRLQGIPLSGDASPYPRIDPITFPAKTGDAPDMVDIKVPFNDVAPPGATTEAELSGNLDADAAGKGTLLYSQAFLHHAEAGDLAIGLRDASGEPLGIQAGDVLTFSARAGDSLASAAVTIKPASTLGDLSEAITVFLRGQAVDAGAATTADLVTPADDAFSRGAVCVYGNSRPIRNFQVTSDRPVSGPRVMRAFAVPVEIPAGTTRLRVTTETFRSPATAADPLAELYDANGNGLGLEAGDEITVSGSIGGTPVLDHAPLAYQSGPSGTRLGDILRMLKEEFKLPERDGSPSDDSSVALDPAGSDDGIPDGSIIVRGQPETASAIRDVAIRATDANNAAPSPNFFNTNLDMTTLREATDSRIGKSSSDVYDDSGKAHPLTIRFIPTRIPGAWSWEAGLGGTETLLKGGRGKLVFGSDGSVETFLTDALDARLEFDPGNGCKTVSLTLYAGGPGLFTGMTQFPSETTVAISHQNGFPAGRLRGFRITQDGLILAGYTNGKSRFLFQIPLADFPNPKGLTLIGANSFLETPESGKPVVSWGLGTENTLIRPGEVEYATAGELALICGENADCLAGK